MVDKVSSTNSPANKQGERGQALVEYGLILALVAIALAAAVAATGPAIGNVFSNVVCNLVQQQQSCQTSADISTRGGPTAFWLTITAVATNPPKDRTFPTNVPLPPTLPPTAGPSPTATPITPTVTPSYTPTKPPTPTPTDIGHVAPFYDPIDQPAWWRVDSSVYLGGHDWLGQYYAGTNLDNGGTVSPDATMENWELAPANTYSYNIAFDWGNGGPVGTTQLQSWLTDNFSVRWTRDVYVFGTTSQTLSVSIRSDNGVRFFVDGTNIAALSDWSGGRTFSSNNLSSTITLTPGPHTFKVEYFESTGTAGIFVNIAQFKGNVRDDAAASGSPNCPWTRITGSQPNSVIWTWKESPDPTGSGFPPGMLCNLELRGYVDVSNLTTPTMSFWDVWDFGAATTVKIQFAEYAPYVYSNNGTPSDPTDDVVTPGSGPNWSAYPPITLHTGGKNYAWSESVIPIPNVPSQKITYRFILQSTAAAGTRRWYVDDIRVDDSDPGKTFSYCQDKATCPSYWDLDDPSQKNDFIATGRWDLTADNTMFGSAGSWAVSGGTNANNGNLANYVNFGPEQTNPAAGSGAVGNNNRIHALEFKGKLSFSLNADGSGIPPDWAGNDGYPQLTFYHSYNLDKGESLEIQYTRDPLDAVADNWQTVAVLLNTLTGPSTLPMTQVSVPLNSIPAWNTTPFRLRFALIVDGATAPSSGGGWWIDEIIIERKSLPRFTNYPFCDTADGVFDPAASGGFKDRGLEQWLVTGQWGLANKSKAGGVRSFTDSPSGNYISGQQTSMTLHYPIDFNNDSPENLTVWGGNKGETSDGVNCTVGVGTKANHPMLTFWQFRKLAPNESVSVDISRAANASTGTTAILPQAIWTYSYNSRTNNQVAWERVEIDLDAAILKISGKTLAQWALLPDTHDDDFQIAIRLDTTSDPSVSDGVYVDDITIQDYSEVSHKLWNTSTNVTPLPNAPAAGAGNGGRYIDGIDNPSDWWNRWETGGNWDAGSPTTEDWGAHSGIYAFTDSPNNGVTYQVDQLSILEMDKIIDLRGAKTTDNPTLYFWDHYNIGRKGKIMVQIAQQDQAEMTGAGGTPRTKQGYDYVYNWGSTTSYAAGSSWDTTFPANGATIWSRPELSRVDTWVREQIDLSSYADDPSTTTVNEGKRIRIRFVLDTLDVTSANLRDGWTIDDIDVEFRNPRIYPLPFFDAAQNTSNWVTEGIWGLAPDYFKGSGGGPAQFGPNPYNAYWFDCIQWMATWKLSGHTTPTASDLTPTACAASDATTFLNSVPRTKAGTDSWVASHAPSYPVLTDTVNSVDNDFGSVGRPFGAPTGAAGSTWDDYYMGRWMRDVTVATGDYTFITTSDDGVQMRYETTPAGGAPAGWNIINDWGVHARKVDMNTVHLNAGSYQLVLEYFESTGNAVIILQAGNNNFSFSDSPKPSITSPAVTSVAYGNSSLMLDGLISLARPATGVFAPRLQYYTYYDLGASATANAEVSIDGGFTWTNSNLTNNCPTGVQCSPTIAGTSSWLPTQGVDWQLRSHDLSSVLYVNRNIGLRFRLNTQSDVRDGWWITEIQVNN